MDSGATQHMAYNKHDFVTYTQLPYLGDDRKSIQGKGNVRISLNDEQERIIPDVLHVLALRKNLFSMTQFVIQGGVHWFNLINASWKTRWVISLLGVSVLTNFSI